MATEEFQIIQEKRHILNTQDSFLSTGESKIERFPSRENLHMENGIGGLSEGLEMHAQFLGQSFGDMDDEEMDEQPCDLTEDMIAEGLSQLGRSADGAMQVFLTLFLPGYNIASVEPLAEYIHLQTVVLSYNRLTDLSPLGCMPNLISLDVSHNELAQVLDFTPPLGLREVNYSHNMVEYLPDLSAHHSITTLILDYNHVTAIQGLSACKRLSLLTMSHNKVHKISGLENLPLKKLDLSHNCLKKIEGLDTLKYIETIHLDGNSIRSLKGLQNHDLLSDINLEENQIIDVAEIRYIRELPLIKSLNLDHNPIQSMPDYRLSLLFRIQSLSNLTKQRLLLRKR